MHRTTGVISLFWSLNAANHARAVGAWQHKWCITNKTSDRRPTLYCFCAASKPTHRALKVGVSVLLLAGSRVEENANSFVRSADASSKRRQSGLYPANKTRGAYKSQLPRLKHYAHLPQRDSFSNEARRLSEKSSPVSYADMERRLRSESPLSSRVLRFTPRVQLLIL